MCVCVCVWFSVAFVPSHGHCRPIHVLTPPWPWCGSTRAFHAAHMEASVHICAQQFPNKWRWRTSPTLCHENITQNICVYIYIGLWVESEFDLWSTQVQFSYFVYRECALDQCCARINLFHICTNRGKDTYWKRTWNSIHGCPPQTEPYKKRI